jgi:hypothetical protein
MEKIKILSYAINLSAINLSTYTHEEKVKCMNNIAQIISSKTSENINNKKSKEKIYIFSLYLDIVDKRGLHSLELDDSTDSHDPFNIISLQEIKNDDWITLEKIINQINPDFLNNYDIYTTGNNLTGLVTMINKQIYTLYETIITGFLLSDDVCPLHFFLLNNNIIFINLELPTDLTMQSKAISTLKSLFSESDVKKEYINNRVIITCHFRGGNKELFIGPNKILDGYNKNNLFVDPQNLLTSTDKKIPGIFLKSYSQIFDNFNNFSTYKTLTDLSKFTQDKLYLSTSLPIIAELSIHQSHTHTPAPTPTPIPTTTSTPAPTLNEIKKKYNKIFTDFKNFVNVEFVISNINNLDIKINTLKNDLNTFESNYGSYSQDIANNIIKMKNIIDEQTQLQQKLQQFNETDDFSLISHIKTYDKSIFGTLITNITVFGSKISSSDSLILKGLYNGKPSFIKMFSLTKNINGPKNYGLIYEQRIYEYLMKRNELKLFYEDNFVKVYDVFKINYYDFFSKLDEMQIKIQGGNDNNKLYYSTTKSAVHTSIPASFLSQDYNVYFTVTENIQGETYEQFFLRNLDKNQVIIETLFEIIYGIYLLNNRLGIIHNDNHFNNILIKPEIKNKEYIIDKISFYKEQKYRICLYDFDLSYFHKNNVDNGILILHENQKYGRKNSYTESKDIWTIVNNIWLLIYDKSKFDKSTTLYKNMLYDVINESYIFNGKRNYTYIYYLINQVFLSTEEQKNTIRTNFINNKNSNKYWNTFCSLSSTPSSCILPNFPELNPELVLKRYIAFYKDILNFKNVNAFYKKYLKYKEKYLKLKNKLIL